VSKKTHVVRVLPTAAAACEVMYWPRRNKCLANITRTCIVSFGSTMKETSRAVQSAVCKLTPDRARWSVAPGFDRRATAIRFSCSSRSSKFTLMKGARTTSAMNQGVTAAFESLHLSYFFKILRNPEKFSCAKVLSCTICSPRSSRRFANATPSTSAPLHSSSSRLSSVWRPLSSSPVNLLMRSISCLNISFNRISGDTSGLGPNLKKDEAQ